jgi:hypothetical protein
MKKKKPFLTLDVVAEEDGEFITSIDLTKEQTEMLIQYAFVDFLKKEIKKKAKKK